MSSLIGFNYIRNNNFYHKNSNGNEEFRDMDGLFGHTTLMVSNNCFKLQRINYFRNYYSIRDNGKDKFVDLIYIQSGNLFRGINFDEYTRDNHQNKYPGIFADADKNLEKTLDRFGIGP